MEFKNLAGYFSIYLEEMSRRGNGTFSNRVSMASHDDLWHLFYGPPSLNQLPFDSLVNHTIHPASAQVIAGSGLR